MPIILKKVEMSFNLGMVAEHRLVEFNLETGYSEQGKITININSRTRSATAAKTTVVILRCTVVDQMNL